MDSAPDHNPSKINWDTALPQEKSISLQARCLGCGYRLYGLDEYRCPECGKNFDPIDETTFSTKPPFIFWRFWLPGSLLSLICGAALFAAMMAFWPVGWAITIAAPLALGVFFGYLTRLKKLVTVVGAICLIIGILAILFTASFTGMLCSLVSLVILGGPVLVGALAGWYLRQMLKQRGYDQSAYLPAIMILSPLLFGAVEGMVPRKPLVTSIQSERIVDGSAAEVWQRLRFYEQIKTPKPLLMRLAGPKPRATTGAWSKVGDEMKCLYERGFVCKRITCVDPPRRLAFEVLEHQIGEDRSVRLLRGNFDLAPIDAMHTRVILTTTYDALLRPRFAWYPFELYVTRKIHEHILNGLADSSVERGQYASSLEVHE